MRTALAAAGVVVLIIATTVAYFLLRPAVEGAVTSVTVVGDHRVDVTFEVHKPRGKAATCVVRSRGDDGQEVGRAVVRLPAGPSVVRETYRLATTSHAQTGELQECHPVG